MLKKSKKKLRKNIQFEKNFGMKNSGDELDLLEK